MLQQQKTYKNKRKGMNEGSKKIDFYSTRLDDTQLPLETQADRQTYKQTNTRCTQVRKK